MPTTPNWFLRGDRDSAYSEGVLFYPIMPGSERDSWKRFREEALPRFLNGTYRGEYMDSLVREYEALLPEHPTWATV